MPSEDTLSSCVVTSGPSPRATRLMHLIDISQQDAMAETVSARRAVISKLEAAHRTEVARGKSGSWLYDVTRHLRLCSALREERRDLAKAGARRGNHALAGEYVRQHTSAGF